MQPDSGQARPCRWLERVTAVSHGRRQAARRPRRCVPRGLAHGGRRPGSFPAWPGVQSRVLSPNSTGGLTPLRTLRGLQETRVATREESGVLGFPSRRGLTPRGSLTFSLSSFTFIKRLFSSSSLSAIRVVSSAYLRLLMFLPAIWIPACASSSLAFRMMYYSACKLNKQGDNIQP